MMPTLPFELVEEILRRLPVKSLKRFCCVAKSWCSLIDDHRFIKSHWQRSLATKSHHHYIMQGRDFVLSIRFDAPNKAELLKLVFPCKIDDGFANSCNGLVLIRSTPPVLCNPFTRDYKVLPHVISDGFTASISSVRIASIMYGLAYDSRNDDYKVVRVVEHRCLVSSSRITSHADMYSLKSDSWKRLEKFPYPLPFLESWLAHINGALHTLIEDSNTIQAFSIETEKHSELKMSSIIQKQGMNIALHKVGGCLSVLCSIKSNYELWVMKDYGVRDSWTRISIHSAESFRNMDVVVMHSDDGRKIMVYHENLRLLCWFDLVNGTKDIIEVPANVSPFVLYGDARVESLVLLGNKEKNAQGQTEDKKMKRKKDEFLSVGFKLVL